MRRILVTSALPYANGPIHLGHLVEYIQTDIWVRHQKMSAHRCFYVCADDAHGTAIMLKAQEHHTSAETWIKKVSEEHQRDFAEFGVGFDIYHSTHSEENKQCSESIYLALKANGKIHKKTITQPFDQTKQIFLPDRYIKGTCPKCKATQQYGDVCEVCGSTYDPLEMIDPVSVLSGETPIKKDSEHVFFDLATCQDFLTQWMNTAPLQKQVKNKLEEWLVGGLKAWDISRDPPYFGFLIPGESDKYFYVWLDAPIGYMAAFHLLCQQQGEDFDAYWRSGSDTELYHFIGKDILYFHGLFWPAMLHYSGHRTPSAIFGHGFLTIDGEKMSKSRGTFITARKYLDHLPPEALRYYYASKLSSHIEDIDLNWQDFIQKVNSDVVGKFVNIASRCARLIHQHCHSRLAVMSQEPSWHDQAVAAIAAVRQCYEQRHYAEAIRLTMNLADAINRDIDQARPWDMAKQQGYSSDLEQCLSQAIAGYRVLCGLLKPVLPQVVEKSEKIFGFGSLSWDNLLQPLKTPTTIAPFEHLFTRLNAASITAVMS